MHCSRIPKPSSTSIVSAASTSLTVSGVSQLESATVQCLRGSFVGRSTTAHTPESTHISSAEQHFAGLRLLAEASLLLEASASQYNPFQALATHQTVTFDDEYQQPDDSSLLSNEPSQLVDGSEPVVSEESCEISLFTLPAENGRGTTTRATTSIPERKILSSINDHFRQALSGTAPEAVLTAIAGDPRLVTGEFMAVLESDPADKWIVLTGDKKRPFKCGYKGCGRMYCTKQGLKRHIFSKNNKYIKDSGFRCYLGDCAGKIRYRSNRALTRHVHVYHTFDKPFKCDICKNRFRRVDHLHYHRKHVHSLENEKKSPKQKK